MQTEKVLPNKKSSEAAKPKVLANNCHDYRQEWMKQGLVIAKSRAY